MMKIHRLVLPIVLGIALAIALLSAAVHQSHAALEPKPGPLSPLPPSALLTREADSPQATIRYVATSGADTGACTDSANPCRTVQYAVDRAVEGDEVRVAGGVYSDIHIRPRQDITTTGYVTQVVYISKTISIQGGYTLTNWIIPDPDTNPTVLDAQGQGRVVYISGRVSPTIEGIVITGGDANNQGGWYIPGLMTDQDVGGGFYIITASATISNCEISLNSSPDYGGGAVLVYSSVRLLRNNINTNNASAGGGIASFLGYNSVISNTISNNTGGGMYLGGEYGLQVGNEQVVRNLFTENSGSLGAGILLWYAPPATLSENILNDNFADQGGGIYSFYSDPILSGNRILANQANSGGGLYLLQYYGVMDSNVVASNTADSTGGLYLDGGAPIITNNIFTRNHSESYGSGMSIDISHSARLMNNTIANNTGGYGMGITVMSNSQIVLTNTIITSQSIGIFVAGGSNQNAVFMEGTLWGSGAWANGQDWAGGGPIYTGTVNVWGDPGFVNPENGNYHIDHDSAAVDAGVDAGVYTDIDGEPRPAGAGFDIGADELQSNTLYVATTGADSSACTDSANPCRTVQYAIDRAVEGDEVRVAAGEYSDINDYGTWTQVVYLTKTLAIQGGYTLTNWITPDPIANQTSLKRYDSSGTLVYIFGHISPTVTGFDITGGLNGAVSVYGDAIIQFNRFYRNQGTGLVLQDTRANINNNSFFDNLSGIGVNNGNPKISNNVIEKSVSAGIGMDGVDSETVVANNVISGNQGAGLWLGAAPVLITGNQILSNTQSGIRIINCDYYPGKHTRIENNTIYGNTGSYGGGIAIDQCGPHIRNNLIKNNYAQWQGGGIALIDTPYVPAIIEGNTIISNSSDFAGGGAFLAIGSTLVPPYSNQFVNNIVANNRSEGVGSGISIWGASLHLAHNTIAQNTGGDGSGIHVNPDGGIYFQPALYNNIIVSHTVGITVGAGSTVTLESTLWGSGAWANGQDWVGEGIYTGTVNVWGDPGFVNPENGDYHIGYDSAAVDAGVDAGVYTDIDGEPRPAGAGFDIGADELQAGTRYVSTTGADSSACTDSANPCRTVQYAIDRAVEGDEVRVAGGVYTGTHIRPRQDITTTGYVTQVVYISKTISIRGGYTQTNWITPDPDANPTVLDAEGLGRVVYITGLISPSIEGFHIIQGNSTGLGGINFPYSQYDLDAGGGIYIHYAATLISNVHVISNTSPFRGGGIHLSYSNSTLQSNYITQNSSDWQGGGLSAFQGKNTLIRNELSNNQGGGLYQDYGESVISENVFFNNIGGYGGGGLYLDYTASVLNNNEIRANSAIDGSGGGVYISDSVIELQNNIINGNSLPNSNGGGGIYAASSDLLLMGNIISENYSFATGGILLSNTNADIVNNTIIENDSLYNAAGIMIWAIDDININIRHNTFARNRGDVGAGVVVATGLVTLTNNIIVSQTIGVYYGGDVTLEGTLWGSGAWANGQDWDGSGTIITGTVNVWGDPGFIDPDNGNYRINQSSAALDAGVNAGVYTDIDGESRPAGAGFDIGADELQASLSLGLSASPNPVASGNNLTYTLILTNTGVVELNATITATLPAQVTPGGSLTWTAYLPAGSDPWMETVVVIVDPSYAGPLTSTLEAISLKGARQVVTSTVTAIQPVSGLAALNSSPTPLGQWTTFTATVATGSGVLFEWNFGDGSSASGTQVSHLYPSTGIYSATVTASNAVSSQSEPVVVIIEEAIAGLSVAASSPTVLGQMTVFTATVAAGSNESYTWDFGDGTSGSDPQTTHTYPAVGNYTATVMVSNLVSGISASTTVRVTQPDHNLYLPIIIKSVWITDQHFKDLPKNFQLLYLNRSKMFFTTEPTEF